MIVVLSIRFHLTCLDSEVEILIVPLISDGQVARQHLASSLRVSRQGEFDTLFQAIT